VILVVSSFAAPAGAQDEVDAISVVHTPDEVQGPCLPATQALGHTVLHTDETFTITITVSAPLCTPIEAVAAVYRMPGSGAAWPQQLMQTEPVSLGPAGVTEIVFTKTCLPVQFDLVVGATPQTIAPWGAWHGPLLFPNDMATAYQHWGSTCEPTTTTSTTTTSSTTSTTTTSTTVPEVLGSTTILPPTEQGPAEVGPEVLGTNEEPAALALTGLSTRGLTLLGLSMVLGGLSLLAFSRDHRSGVAGGPLQE
jgi:hypothetical protein